MWFRAGGKFMAFDVTIKEYLKEIDESPLLNWEEEKYLSELIIDQQDPEARDRLVRSNLRLVVNIAKKFPCRGLTLGDLIEEGNLGLLRAVDSFDPEHGVRFSTYASWWIKQSIKKALLTNTGPIHIPTYMVELVNQWRYAAARLETSLGRTPRLLEMAEATNLNLKKANAVQKIIEAVNAGFQENSAESNEALDEDIQDSRINLPEDVLGTDEELAKAVELLSEIEPREAEVLALRFGLGGNEPLTLKEIGHKIGLTRERVRQIQRDALTKLNEFMTEQ